MAKSRNKPQPVVVNRPPASNLMRNLMAPPASRSEGHALQLQPIKFQEAADGTTISFGLDISTAPVPQRRYACDVCSLEFDGRDVRFIFGQKSLGDGPLDSALVIRMSPIAGEQFYTSIEQMHSPGLVDIARITGIAAESLQPIKERPHQMANMVANFVGVAVSGFETCLDFYHASAFSMRNAIDRNSLEIEPVVRVDIRTSLFMSVVDELKSIVTRIAAMKAEASHA